MTKLHSLDYEYEHDYTLIGINSTLSDYRLAYCLNKDLQIYLKRQSENLDFTSKNCSFTLYKYDCKATFSSWALVLNKHVLVSNTIEETNLFKQESKTSYLINEKKEIDYFLKIFGDFDSDSLKLVLKKIKKIKGVVTSYVIDPYSLKSKDFLIF